MKKYVLGAFIGFLLLMSGCRDRQDGVHTEDTDLQKEKLTIMHVDAESPGFRKFIENAEKELNLEIETIACPADADVRQAKISTILEAGDSSIDIFYPIWWYVAPTIINTFLEAYDFSGKKLVLFATSGGSGFGNTVKELQSSASDAVITEGRLLNCGTKQEITEWVNSL